MWISINDRVPDDSDPEVLLFIEDDYPNMFSGYFYEAVADHSVTHWMPLPSPPTAEIVEGANLQTHNIESAQCHHRFKQTPSATMVQCVDCGAKFDYNPAW